jgi:ubiquinol-cytochrome c reductase cytochrome c subunit
MLGIGGSLRSGRRSGHGFAALLAAAIAVVVTCAGTPVAAASETPSPAPSSGVTQSPDVTAGAVVFAENCVGCHGSQGRGGVGPTLQPAGFASLVSAMVEQGGIEMPPFGQALDEAQIGAVAAFVSQEIADPAARTAEVAQGGEIYRLYCAGCHSATGRGGALTKGRNAPDISQYPAAMALAAMILGRGNMPVFAGNTLDVRQQAAVARYVEVLVEPPSPGGRGLGYLGPVPEGAVAAAGLLVLIALAVWLAWKTRRAAP